MKRVSLPAVVMFTMSAVAATAAGVSASCTFFEDRVSLLNCGVLSTATGTRRVRIETDCDHNLHVEIQDVPRGLYSVLVDGVERGTIRVTGKHEGQLEFDTSPRGAQLPLDFDPFGHIDVAAGPGRVIMGLDQCPAQ